MNLSTLPADPQFGKKMPTVRKSRNGIEYLLDVLRESPQRITRVALWRIPHSDPGREDISLKIGRYKRAGTGTETPESDEPKSALTLGDEEFRSLIRFLEENYEPFRAREHSYIPLSSELSPRDIEQLRELFTNPDKKRVVNLVIENALLPADVLAALQFRSRQESLVRFREMLTEALVEHDWQRWFQTNDWVFGSDFVRVLDERAIDTDNIADYLMEAYDGFLDIIEIKRPSRGLRFWAETRDHENLVPATDLVKAITQVTNYLFEVEQEANSQKFLDRVGVRVVKPRATLVFGRSEQWGDDERHAYRILNRSYHDLTVLTYDHVLDRAERILASPRRESEEGESAEATADFDAGADDDFPF